MFGVHEQALKLRSQRTAVLANNLANADTPGFKARDMNFSELMQRASNKQQFSTRGMKATQAGHINTMNEMDQNLMFRTPKQPSMDGNTVDTHTEMAEFAQNQMAFNASFRFMNGRIKGVISAIRGD